MTANQIYALIAITLLTGFVYWLAYRNGFTTGHSEGQSEGYSEGYDVGGCVGYRDGQDAASEKMRQMENRCRSIELVLAFGQTEHMHLQQIAKQLLLAADTFRALKSDQEKQAIYLHKQALAMAALLGSSMQERAA